MSKVKVLVYGITGMTGTRITQLLKGNFKIIAPPHSHLDLLDIKQVLIHLKDVLPNQIIYSAGITKVDQAQANPKLAYLINSQVPKFISKQAAKLNIPVIYVSTDAVFPGTLSSRPYKEYDRPDPISIYGKSKLAGERAVLSAAKTNCVVRTIMIFSANYPHKKDFARLAYESLSRGEKFEAIVDQIINPTYVDDLVWALNSVLKKNAQGVYHVASTSFASNYEFVEKIAKAFNFKKDLITKKGFDEFFNGKLAKRTKYCWLDTEKFQKEFGKRILHNIDQSISLFKKQISLSESGPIDI